ncbi:hypothetical protein F4808DRAFT_454234 [Astrocystis sublimbata]|nr:hypothetical protein F4808DRAFT_454234 [Astrocystis sublimbata]
MRADLFKVLAIAAVFLTVQSAPVETAEGQVNGTQVNEVHTNETHTNEAHVDDGVQKICYRDKAPHISTREREGDIFARACRDYTCYSNYQCIRWGCIECNLYFDACGNSYTLCY